eukprot:UN09827
MFSLIHLVHEQPQQLKT